jgi:hypothetical protein
VNPIDFLRNAGNIVDVVAQSQLDSLSYTLSNYQTIVMYGHDEYWTPSLRATLETAVTGGVSLLNLSGNTGYRRILRSGTSISYETPNRWGARPGETTVQQLLCAKFLGFPFNRVHDISQPLTKKEYQALLNDGLPRTIAKKKVYRYLRGMRVTSLESGLFAGTTLQVGSWFGTKSEVLFIEADGIPLTHSGQPETSFLAGFSAPGVTSFSAESWMQKRTKRRYHARTGFLIVGKYGTGNVFTAGSIGWVNAIIKGDVNVRQITLNALNKISISSTPDPNPPV